MWWCKLRQGVLSIVSGGYASEEAPVDVHAFGQDQVRGRPGVTFAAPRCSVTLDTVAWSVLVDNALSNALRHQDPKRPSPHLNIELKEVEPAEADVCLAAPGADVVTIHVEGAARDPCFCAGVATSPPPRHSNTLPRHPMPPRAERRGRAQRKLGMGKGMNKGR